VTNFRMTHTSCTLCQPHTHSPDRNHLVWFRPDVAQVSKAGLANLGADSKVVCEDGSKGKLADLLVIFFAKVFAKNPKTRATIEQVAANPLFQYSQAECAEAVVAEIEVVQTLKAARTRARKE
jgi:hypothetical protein